MNMFEIFKTGALAMVNETMAYSEIHQKFGLSADDWKLVTQKELWTVEERQRVRSILQECVQISLTVAGLPGQNLPAQYVAAVIAHIVSPSNLLVASTRAPEAFDAVNAAGLQGEHQVKPVPVEMMQALVMAYAGGAASEPIGMAVEPVVEQAAKKAASND